MRKLYGVGGALFFDEQTSTSVSVIVTSNTLRGNPADTLLGSGGGARERSLFSRSLTL